MVDYSAEDGIIREGQILDNRMDGFCLKTFLEVIGGRFIELPVHRQIGGRSGGPDSEALLAVGRGNEIQALDPRPETIPRFGACCPP